MSIKKTAMAALAASTLAPGTIATSTSAEAHWRGGWGGGWVGPATIGGIALGALAALTSYGYGGTMVAGHTTLATAAARITTVVGLTTPAEVRTMRVPAMGARTTRLLTAADAKSVAACGTRPMVRSLGA